MLDFISCELEVVGVQILNKLLGVSGLWDNSETTRGCPAKKDLSRCLVILGSKIRNQLMFEERGAVNGLVPLQLDE